MNKAGQNAYEGNMLNIGLQFMGWAHRWLGITTGSRVFNKADKAKLWTWQLLMYGIPGGYAGYGVFESMLPKDPKTKDIIVQGLAGASYNKIASVISGEDVHADWRSEERRVGKECGSTCRSSGSPEHIKKKKKT